MIPTTTSGKSWLSTPPSDSFPTTLWRAVVMTPTGERQTVEVRAVSEQLARDRIGHWKPEWTVLAISRRATDA